MQKSTLFIYLFAWLPWQNIWPQTTVNPDVSVVGDFRVFSHDDSARSNEKERLNLTDPGVELDIAGYLNPYARADVVIGWHGGHNAEIEEAYATILRGLPLNAGLRVGKYLLGFGRLNPVHPHAYSFIKRPLPHEYLFGEEGLSDMAVCASFSLPTGGAFTELTGGILRGGALVAHHHDEEVEDGHEHNSESARDLGAFVRLTTSMAVSEAAELAVGGSVLNAVGGFSEHEDEELRQLRSWLIGGDMKYKYRQSRYAALQIEAEYIMRLSEAEEDQDDLTSCGAYAYVDYRFRQKYNVGGILEWTGSEELYGPEGDGEHERRQHDIWRVGVFVGYAPIEETSLVRLAGHWNHPEGGDRFWEATLQLVISLGPHVPHNF